MEQHSYQLISTFIIIIITWKRNIIQFIIIANCSATKTFLVPRLQWDDESANTDDRRAKQLPTLFVLLFCLTFATSTSVGQLSYESFDTTLYRRTGNVTMEIINSLSTPRLLDCRHHPRQNGTAKLLIICNEINIRSTTQCTSCPVHALGWEIWQATVMCTHSNCFPDYLLVRAEDWARPNVPCNSRKCEEWDRQRKRMAKRDRKEKWFCFVVHMNHLYASMLFYGRRQHGRFAFRWKMMIDYHMNRVQYFFIEPHADSFPYIFNGARHLITYKMKFNVKVADSS